MALPGTLSGQLPRLMEGSGRVRAGIAMLVAVVAAAGCELDPERVCEEAIVPAVTVVVRDSVANTPIAQDVELVGILRDGSYTESMWRWRSELSGGDDRPGNYEVEIRAEGYLTWTRSGIVVEPGAVCPIDYPAELTARLVSETGLPAVSANPTSVSVVSVPTPSGILFTKRLGGQI